jgi:hypothetical protein
MMLDRMPKHRLPIALLMALSQGNATHDNHSYFISRKFLSKLVPRISLLELVAYEKLADLPKYFPSKNYPSIRVVDTLCSSNWHADDFSIIRPTIPKLKQDQVGGTKCQFCRARATVIENVSVQELMESLKGNLKGLGSFYFREGLFFRP